VRRAGIVVLAFLSGGICRAAFEPRETGAGSFFPDPGRLGTLDHKEAAFSYSRLFSLSDLSVSGFSFASPTRLGGVALKVAQFGPPAYREQEFSLSHGFNAFSRLNAGYSLKGLFLKIDGYGSSAKFGLDLGARARVTERLDLSLAGENINRPAFGDVREPVPSLWTSGMTFRVRPGLTAALGLEGLGAASPRLRTGLELELSPALSLMGGLASGPSRFSGGFRARRKGISLEYAYRHHPFLPGSHHMELTFSWAGPAPAVQVPAPHPKMDILSATVLDLAAVHGVGELTAQKVIAYRDRFGLRSADDLLNVPGMNKRVFFLLKDIFAFGPARP